MDTHRSICWWNLIRKMFDLLPQSSLLKHFDHKVHTFMLCQVISLLLKLLRTIISRSNYLTISDPHRCCANPLLSAIIIEKTFLTTADPHPCSANWFLCWYFYMIPISLLNENTVNQYCKTKKEYCKISDHENGLLKIFLTMKRNSKIVHDQCHKSLTIGRTLRRVNPPCNNCSFGWYKA